MKRETFKLFAYKTKGGRAGLIHAPGKYTEAYARNHYKEWLDSEARSRLMNDEVTILVGIYILYK